MLLLLVFVMTLNSQQQQQQREKAPTRISRTPHRERAISHTALMPNQTYLFEKMLAQKEQNLMHSLNQLLNKKHYTIRGFYHVSTWRDKWRPIIQEQLMLLDGQRRFPPAINQSSNIAGGSSKSNQSSVAPINTYQWQKQFYTSLLAASDQLHMNVAGTTIDSFYAIEELLRHTNLTRANRAKIQLHYSRTIVRGSYNDANSSQRRDFQHHPKQLTEGEVSTLWALHDFCTNEVRHQRDAMVYYFHNKGSCCYRDHDDSTNRGVSSWRELMNTFNIEFSSICIRALLKGYSACGTDNQDAMYSGNFWWADCLHIAALPKLSDPFDAYAVESSIFNVSSSYDVRVNFASHCGYSSINCPLSHYDNECPRTKYLERLQQFVRKLPILPSSTAYNRTTKQTSTDTNIGSTSNIARASNNDLAICTTLRKRSYAKQQATLNDFF